MELSEHERRLLREMETHLVAEDPSLASSLSFLRLRVGMNRLLAVSGLVVGVLLMGVGLWRAHLLGIAIALVGFLVLLASTNATMGWVKARRERRPAAAKVARNPRRAT